MIIEGARVAFFVSETCGFGLCPPFTAIGIEREGKVVAGVLFNCFEGADVHVTVAGRGWTRSFIETIGLYVYGHLGCERMTITTEQPVVAGYALRLGGREEGLLRNHYGRGRDGIVVGILKDDWHFAKVPNCCSAAEPLQALPGRGSERESPKSA